MWLRHVPPRVESCSASSGVKRAAILLAISRYQDSTSFITSQEEWMSMSNDMGAVDTTKLISAVSTCR